MKECLKCKRCFLDSVECCSACAGPVMQTIADDPMLNGRYRFEARLGQGGMGVVYKAHHIFLKTPHAIKIILPELIGNDPLLVKRFRQEAMAAAAIRHLNTVAVTDFGVVRDSAPFLVMEFISGVSLHELLTRHGKMTPAQALEIMTGVAAGVTAAHRQGIVHRDLKPLNIMLQEGLLKREAVKVLDFGLAKIKSGELLGSLLQAQTIGLLGSPFYMAPEQWSEEDLDGQADVYSLGVILYQMLAGDVPFKGPSVPAIMKKHLMSKPPAFATLGASVPPAVEEVVLQALEKDPAHRPASVQAFLHALAAAVAASAESEPMFVQTEVSADLLVDTISEEAISAQLAETVSSNSELELSASSLAAAEARAAERAAAERLAAEEAARQAAEEAARQAEAERQQRQAEEAAALARELEEAQRLAEAARQRALEAERAAQELAEQERQIREEQERQRAEAEAQTAREIEQARRRAEEEARQRAETEARQRAATEARRQAEAEQSRRRAAEEAQRRAEEAARLAQQAEEARLRAEAAAARRVEEQRQRETEELSKREAEAQRAAAEQERQAAEARRLAEAERQRQEALRRKQEEEQQAAAEERRRKEQEAAERRAAEEARQAEERRREARQQREAAAHAAAAQVADDAPPMFGVIPDTPASGLINKGTIGAAVGVGVLLMIGITYAVLSNGKPAARGGTSRAASANTLNPTQQQAAQITAQAIEHLNAGLALKQRMRRKEAEAEFFQAESLAKSATLMDPGNATLHANLASVMIVREEWAAAEAEYREAARLDPGHADYADKLKQLAGRKK